MATDTKSAVPSLSLVTSLLLLILVTTSHAFEYKEATIDGIQKAFDSNEITSQKLVEFYKNEIKRRNGTLAAVIELNPDAESEAQKADQKLQAGTEGRTKLSGIPILLKDNLGTKDKLNTTAGSYALLGKEVPGDAFVVKKLREAGAIILGKASLSEWAAFRSPPPNMPNGWCARVGQGKNPYNLSQEVRGSSSGSAISTAANLVTVALGTETAGSILSPSSYNSVVGIKPTVNLTSRTGVIPVSRRQDTVGPIARTVRDAVYVLDIIVGGDENDPETIDAATHIPAGGYAPFLKSDGLNGKKLGIYNFEYPEDSPENKTYQEHYNTLREKASTVIDNLEINGEDEIFPHLLIALKAEFKRDLNTYLAQLQPSPVLTLEDLIKFNNENNDLEKTEEYGQEFFLEAQQTNGIDQTVQNSLAELEKLSRNGFEKLMTDNKLDALVFPEDWLSVVLSIGGFPAITVPAGYNKENKPLGLTFAGLKYSEGTLIEIAYAFEQLTKKRQPPPDNLQMVIEMEGEKVGAQGNTL